MHFFFILSPNYEWSKSRDIDNTGHKTPDEDKENTKETRRGNQEWSQDEDKKKQTKKKTK